MRKRVTGKSNKIFQDRTGVSYYDDMIDNPFYFKRHGLSAKIKKMRPEDYFKESAKLHGVPVENEYEILRDKHLKEYAERTRAGSKMPMPYLNYDSSGHAQEGRHRTVVAKRLGKRTIPVLVVKPMKKEKYFNWILSNIPDSDEAQFKVPKEFKEQFKMKSKRK